jgi:hypothetical protein
VQYYRDISINFSISSIFSINIPTDKNDKSTVSAEDIIPEKNKTPLIDYT